MVDRLRKKLLSAKNAYKSLGRETEAAYAECEKLGEQLKTANQSTHRLQRCLDGQEISSDMRISELENRTVALQSALQNTQREIDKLQNDVRVAQEGALQSMERENHICMEDREVREQLSKMSDRFIAWAKKHSIDDASALESVSETELNMIIQSLHGYYIQENWPQLRSKLPSLFRKIPLLLVQASISNNILHTMFTNPFFLFPVGPDYTSCPSPSQMAKLYGMIKYGT
jgi:chromosome segregation ATPase